MTTKEEIAADATDRVIEIFGRMPPDAVCERITEAIAAAIDDAVSAEQERLVALVTEYGVQPSLIAGIRSRGPAPERPQHTTKCGELWCIGEECPAFGTPLPGAKVKPAPVDPVREAATAVVDQWAVVGSWSDLKRSDIEPQIDALALALEKTEAGR